MKQTVDWHQHWTRKNPGFHEGQVNAYLRRFLPQFHPQQGDRIFMPLCGKAYDILWLAQQGYEVIGVELSPVAVRDFFAESDLEYRTHESGPFSVYSAGPITLYQGDFMDLQPAQIGDCKLIYDRAAIVAIEDFNRAIYCRKLLSLVPEHTPMLMVLLEYDQQVMSGPPFSVPVDEVRDYFQAQYDIELLERRDQIDESPRWRERGLDSFLETSLRLTSRNRSAG